MDSSERYPYLCLEKPQHPLSQETEALEYVTLKSAALPRKVIAHQKLTMPYMSNY